MEEKVFKGISISNGISIGKAYTIREQKYEAKIEKLPKEAVKKEIKRFKTALENAKRDLIKTKEKIIEILGKKHTKLVEAYLLILEDPFFTRDVIRKINDEQVNAEYSLVEVLQRISDSFEKINDSYFRERKNDILETGEKILEYLTGTKRKNFENITNESIIVSHTLTPTDAVSLKERSVAGFVTDIGSTTSHMAIISREFNIPAVCGIKNISQIVNTNDTLIIDGTEGIVIVNPTDETIKRYMELKKEREKKEEEIRYIINLPTKTRDGTPLKVTASINSSEEIEKVTAYKPDGIGLLRTEYLYLNKEELPTEDEHYQVYFSLSEAIQPNFLTVRTVDIGGDKLIKFGVRNVVREQNPSLGLKGIRLCLRYRNIFYTQLKAILKASILRNIRILLPMITTVDEIIQTKEIIEQTKKELKESNIEFDENIKIGIMVETPAIALMLSQALEHVDFISIGTNDLLQYILAVDRTNENIPDLYDPFHPSFLRLLSMITEEARKKGKTISACGELASDVLFIPIFLSLGITELAVSPTLIPKVKKTIIELDMNSLNEIPTLLHWPNKLKEHLKQLVRS